MAGDQVVSWLRMVKIALLCCGNEPGPEDNKYGVPAVTTNPLLMLATSPPVVAFALVGPSGASAGTDRTSVASVSVFTVALVTVMPDPNWKTVDPFQCVFEPVTSTVVVVPCWLVFGVMAEIIARLGVTVKYAPLTT